MATVTKLDQDARYTVKGHRGVAFYIYGFPQVWFPYVFLMECDEEDCSCHENDEDIHEESDGDGEWMDQDEECGKVLMVMVGDDHKWEVDVEDITVIPEGSYCSGCGQIGCCGDGRDRE